MTTLMERMGVDVEALRDQAASAGYSAINMLQEIAANPTVGLVNGFSAVVDVVDSGLDAIVESYTNSAHGQLDALRGASPADQFQGIIEILEENGQSEVITQLNALPEGLQNTFANNLVTDIDFRTSVFAAALSEDATLMTDIQEQVGMQYVQSLPAGERYGALKELDAANGNENQSNFEALDRLPEGIQNAFAHAYANNPEFRAHLDTLEVGEDGQPVAEGDPTLLESLTENLYQRHPNGDVQMHEGQPLIDPVRAGAMQDILVTIGNNPDSYDMDRLTAVQTALESLEAADSPAEERAAELALISSIREAGGNLPAMAGMDAEMGFAFLSNLLDPNISAERAMEMLTDQLGLEGAQLAAFQDQFGPLVEILETFIQPYASLIQEHGPGIRGGVANIMERQEIIAGERVSPDGGWVVHDGGGTDAVRTGEAPIPGVMTAEQIEAASAIPANTVVQDNGLNRVQQAVIGGYNL